MKYRAVYEFEAKDDEAARTNVPGQVNLSYGGRGTLAEIQRCHVSWYAVKEPEKAATDESVVPF